MKYQAIFRLGMFFIAAGAAGILLYALHRRTWEHDFYLLNQPMQVVANRTITDTFTIPVNAPYDINIYVRNGTPYADCLLGQGGYLEERCGPYPSVIDVAWLLHDKEGRVLRKDVSQGTCCAYTTDQHSHPVVYTTLAHFSLPTGTKAYLELSYRRDVSKLQELAPRVVVQRRDVAESELGLEVWAMLGIGAMLLTGLVLLLAAWSQHRTSKMKATA